MGLDGHIGQSTEAWLACVDIPSFTLQILLRDHPEWRHVPAVVVDADKPMGLVIAVNSMAARHGIRRRMRYATALSIVSNVQAGTVSPKQQQEGVAAVIEALQHFSSDVESSSLDTQLFWIRYRGMHRLFPDPKQWIREVRRSLQALGFFATAAVGYSRFGTSIGAKLSRGIRIFSRPAQEERALAQASIDLLPLDEQSYARLQALGVSSIGRFRELGGNQLRRKLGEQAYAVHRFATETDTVPLQAAPEVPDLHFERRLQPPLFDRGRLTEAIRQLLVAVVELVVRNVWAVRCVYITLELELSAQEATAANRVKTEVRPAKPTQDAELLMRLVSLRIETLVLTAAVGAVSVEPDWVALDLEPGELFNLQQSRNIEAGSRALSLLRAELGENAVRVAEPVDAHLPEYRYSWNRCSGVRLPAGMRRGALPRTHAASGEQPRLKLVRRIFAKPTPLSSSPRLRGGPYILSEGWWRLGASAQHPRAYYYAEGNGDLLWIYYDAAARSWLIQGYVE